MTKPDLKEVLDDISKYEAQMGKLIKRARTLLKDWNKTDALLVKHQRHSKALSLENVLGFSGMYRESIQNSTYGWGDAYQGLIKELRAYVLKKQKKTRQKS